MLAVRTVWSSLNIGDTARPASERPVIPSAARAQVLPASSDRNRPAIVAAKNVWSSSHWGEATIAATVPPYRLARWVHVAATDSVAVVGVSSLLMALPI